MGPVVYVISFANLEQTQLAHMREHRLSMDARLRDVKAAHQTAQQAAQQWGGTSSTPA